MSDSAEGLSGTRLAPFPMSFEKFHKIILCFNLNDNDNGILMIHLKDLSST